MGNRHRAREMAIHLLYQFEATGGAPDDLVRDYFEGRAVNEQTREYAETFAKGAIESIARIDPLLASASEHWSLSRILPVDRAILRLAAFEILFAGTAPAVAIDEAIRLAKRFSSQESSSFINGVLDRVKQLGLCERGSASAAKGQI